MKTYKEFVTESSTPAAEIKKVLDDLKMGFVKSMTKNYTYKTILRKKALKGGSIGPMTTTDQYINVNKEVQDKVAKAFRYIDVEKRDSLPYSGEMRNLIFDIRINKNTLRRISFNWDTFPTYVRSAGYDHSYYNFWYVMHSETIKG